MANRVRWRWRWWSGLFVAPLLVAFGCQRVGHDGRLTAYGTVEVTEVRVASRVGGRVTSVLVEEGDVVKKGQPLVRFDLATLAAQRDQAKAAVEGAEARLKLMHEGARRQDVVAAQKALAAANIREDQAKREVARVQKLVTGRVASQQMLDNAKTALDLASSQAAATKAQYQKLLAGARTQELAQAEAAVDQAKAALAGLEDSLKDQEIDAPVDGIVIHRLVEPGEVAGPGTPLIVLGETAKPYVDVYVPEPDVGRTRTGTKADVHVDAFAKKVFHGKVTHVAEEAEFTPKNVQTADQRASLVFRVRVGVDDPKHQLRPGMPASAVFVVGEHHESASSEHEKPAPSKPGPKPAASPPHAAGGDGGTTK